MEEKRVTESCGVGLQSAYARMWLTISREGDPMTGFPSNTFQLCPWSVVQARFWTSLVGTTGVNVNVILLGILTRQSPSDREVIHSRKYLCDTALRISVVLLGATHAIRHTGYYRPVKDCQGTTVCGIGGEDRRVEGTSANVAPVHAVRRDTRRLARRTPLCAFH